MRSGLRVERAFAFLAKLVLEFEARLVPAVCKRKEEEKSTVRFSKDQAQRKENQGGKDVQETDSNDR
jgi:hypothetical protein